MQEASPIINANMDKNDYEVGASTQGNANAQHYLFGIVQIIDGEKWRVFWIPFYEVKGAGPSSCPRDGLGLIRFTGFGEAGDLAYYKALEAAPNADTIIPKAYVIKRTGAFPFYWTTDVTFQGKAVTYKTHN